MSERRSSNNLPVATLLIDKCKYNDAQRLRCDPQCLDLVLAVDFSSSACGVYTQKLPKLGPSTTRGERGKNHNTQHLYDVQERSQQPTKFVEYSIRVPHYVITYTRTYTNTVSTGPVYWSR